MKHWHMQKYPMYALYQDSSSESGKYPNQMTHSDNRTTKQVTGIPLTATILLVFAKLQIRWKLRNPATRNHRTNPRQIRSRKKPSKPPRKRSIPANSLFRRMEHISQGTVVPSTRWNPGAATMIDCGWWITRGIPRRRWRIGFVVFYSRTSTLLDVCTRIPTCA